MNDITVDLDALDSNVPMNSKNLINHFQQTVVDTASSSSPPNASADDSGDIISANTTTPASKKRGTLNSSVNLYTFVKLLEETVRECERDDIEIIPENLIRFVRKYQLNVNKFKETGGYKPSEKNFAKPVSLSDNDEDDINDIVVVNNVDTNNIDEIERSDESDLQSNVIEVKGIKRKNSINDDGVDENDGGDLKLQSRTVKKQKSDSGRLYLNVFNCLFVALERENINVTFSREHLRYFLATYHKLVSLDDFKYINKRNCGDDAATMKKNKSKNILHNGSILLEYVKSPATFQNNLSRCNVDDADALRYAINVGMTLPENIYKPLSLPVNDQIVINKTNDFHEGYVKLMFNGTKHYVICFTENVLLIWDGTQFTIPSVHAEKDITATLLYDTCKENDLYILQTVVCGNRLKIADVIYASTPSSPTDLFVSGLAYVERQRLFKKLFKNWDIVKIENDNYGNSNIQVPDVYYCDKAANRYVFTKPGQIVAAVGVDKQNVLIAFKRTDDDDLEFKIKILNSGPASVILLAQPMRFMSKDRDDKFVRIRDPNGNNVKLYELPYNNEVRIFKKYVPVELRDGTKLGSYMIGQIDDVTEYRQQNLQKGNNMAKLFEKIINDPKHLQDFMSFFDKNVNDSAKERFCNVIKVSDRITNVDLNFKI